MTSCQRALVAAEESQGQTDSVAEEEAEFWARNLGGVGGRGGKGRPQPGPGRRAAGAGLSGTPRAYLSPSCCPPRRSLFLTCLAVLALSVALGGGTGGSLQEKELGRSDQNSRLLPVWEGLFQVCVSTFCLRKELKLRSSMQGPAARAFVFSRSCSTALVFILLLTHKPCSGPSPGQIRHPSIDHSPSHCDLNFHSQLQCHSAHFITPILSILLSPALRKRETFPTFHRQTCKATPKITDSEPSPHPAFSPSITESDLSSVSPFQLRSVSSAFISPKPSSLLHVPFQQPPCLASILHS